MTEDIRLIKKYPNRRLYDTQISQYITLEDVKQLVLDEEAFVVVDKKSGKDITRSILLQVIAEEEESGSPIFSVSYLSQVIRFYGDSIQSGFSGYLDQSMQFFVNQQNQLKDKLNRLVGQNPLQRLEELAEENIPLWKKIRREYLASLNEPKKLESDKAEPEAKSKETDSQN